MTTETPTPLHFSTPTDLATFLDAHCEDWNLRMRDRDLLSVLESATAPAELIPLLKAEKVGLSVWFKGCTVQRESSVTNEAGETWGSPLPQELEPAPFDYYRQRYEHSTNPYLQARYGLLLWNAPKLYKHIRYAQGALQHLLTALAPLDCSTRADRRDCTDLLRQACAIAAILPQHGNEASITATTAAVLDRFTGTIPFEREGRTALLRLVTEHPKLFKASDYEHILATTRDLYTECYAQADFFACETLCKLAEPYAQSVGHDRSEWHRRLGQAYEGEAARRLPSEDSSLISIEFYSRAAKAYQMAGDTAFQEAALQKAQALKPQLKLSTITTEFTAEQTQLLMEDIKQQTEALLAHEPNEILDFLACSPRTLPDYQHIKAQAAQQQPSFLSMVSVIHIDGNKNTSHGDTHVKDKGETEAEAKRRKELNRQIRQSYSLALSFRLQYLLPAFIEGYRAGKITYETVCRYLEAHSWTAQTLTEHDISGNLVEYTWQPMLYPGLREFFTQFDKFIHEGPEAASFVLCLDSLTLKVEGLLREVLQRMGAHTIATHKRHSLREVFFDDLLDLAVAKKLLTEGETYYFRYVFTTLGNNLRNDIAHGYYHLSERYSLHKVILLLMALLRITGFQLRAQQEPEVSA